MVESSSESEGEASGRLEGTDRRASPGESESDQSQTSESDAVHVPSPQYSTQPRPSWSVAYQPTSALVAEAKANALADARIHSEIRLSAHEQWRPDPPPSTSMPATVTPTPAAGPRAPPWTPWVPPESTEEPLSEPSAQPSAEPARTPMAPPQSTPVTRPPPPSEARPKAAPLRHVAPGRAQLLPSVRRGVEPTVRNTQLAPRRPVPGAPRPPLLPRRNALSRQPGLSAAEQLDRIVSGTVRGVAGVPLHQSRLHR